MPVLMTTFPLPVWSVRQMLTICSLALGSRHCHMTRRLPPWSLTTCAWIVYDQVTSWSNASHYTVGDIAKGNIIHVNTKPPPVMPASTLTTSQSSPRWCHNWIKIEISTHDLLCAHLWPWWFCCLVQSYSWLCVVCFRCLRTVRSVILPSLNWSTSKDLWRGWYVYYTILSLNPLLSLLFLPYRTQRRTMTSLKSSFLEWPVICHFNIFPSRRSGLI